MLKAVVGSNGKVKTELDVFDYAKWGNKEDPNRQNVFLNSVLLDSSFYISINTRFPGDKEKPQNERRDTYVSFWVPKDSEALFARKFDRFAREVIKENKGTLCIPTKDKNGKDTSITFTAGINLAGKEGRVFSYFKTEIVNDTKTGVISIGLGTGIKPFGDDSGLAFAESLLVLSERLSTLFVSKADGTVHEHMRVLANQKSPGGVADTSAPNAAADTGSYDEDYDTF